MVAQGGTETESLACQVFDHTIEVCAFLVFAFVLCGC